MLTRKTVILAKIESSYGVDPTPTVSANAILVKNVDIKPVRETVMRDYLRSVLSPLQFVTGVRHMELTFESELKGTGTRGSLPAYGWEGVLFRACGMSETVSAGTSIIYAPVSTGFESCTIYVYKDGILHKLTGARGSFKITAEVGKYGVVQWTFRGLYNAAADVTPGAQTFSSVVPQVCLGASFSCNSYAAIIEKLELDINNSLNPRKSISAATGIVSWEITDRTPNGSFDPESVLEATNDFWTDWITPTAMALSIGPIGTTSGNIVTIAAPKVQYTDLTYGDRNGIVTYNAPFQMAGNSGDDELTITIT